MIAAALIRQIPVRQEPTLTSTSSPHTTAVLFESSLGEKGVAYDIIFLSNVSF